MEVQLSDEAKRQAKEIHAWWCAHRDASGLFKEELAAAKQILRRDADQRGVYCYEAGQAVRRLLLRKTHYHLYYVIEEDLQLVRIVAIWGAVRGTGPKL